MAARVSDICVRRSVPGNRVAKRKERRCRHERVEAVTQPSTRATVTHLRLVSDPPVRQKRAVGLTAPFPHIGSSSASARNREARDRHHPHAVHRCGAEGELGPSRRAHGARAGGLRALAERAPLRPGGADLAQPGPVRALQRARLDAPLLGAPSDGRATGGPRGPGARRARRSRSTTSSPSGSSAAGPRAIPSTGSPAGWRAPPVRWGRGRRTRWGWPSPRAGSGRATTGPASRCSTSTSTPSSATAA